MTIVSFALPQTGPLKIEDPHIDSIEDPVGREVALRLKVAHLQKELANHGLPDPTSFLEPARGYQTQVAELHRAVEMERRLRLNTESMLRETQKAVAGLALKQAEHDRTMQLVVNNNPPTSAPPSLGRTGSFRSQMSLPIQSSLPSSPRSLAVPPSLSGIQSASFKDSSSGYGQISKPTRRPTLGATLKIKPNIPLPVPKDRSRRGRSLDRS